MSCKFAKKITVYLSLFIYIHLLFSTGLVSDYILTLYMHRTILLLQTLIVVWLSPHGYKFLKMVEKFGTLAEFDFLYQKTGVDGRGVGVPRGYAFVTYQTAESAQSAQRTLDGLDVAGRKLAVKWAHLQDQVSC